MIKRSSFLILSLFSIIGILSHLFLLGQTEPMRPETTFHACKNRSYDINLEKIDTLFASVGEHQSQNSKHLPSKIETNISGKLHIVGEKFQDDEASCYLILDLKSFKMKDQIGEILTQDSLEKAQLDFKTPLNLGCCVKIAVALEKSIIIDVRPPYSLPLPILLG